MFNFSKKKTLIGLCGLIVSAGLVALFMLISPPGDITELNFFGAVCRILSIVFLALAIAFSAYIFYDKKAFLSIFIPLTAISLFSFFIYFISESSPDVTLYIISLVFVVAVIFISYGQYKKNCLAISEWKAILNGKIDQNGDNELTQENEFKDSIIVATQIAGTLFQVIKIKSGYLFHHVGNLLRGVDSSKVLEDTSNIDLDPSNQKDYVINYEDIDHTAATIKNYPHMMDFGNLEILLKNGEIKKFGLIYSLEENELKAFFGNIDVTDKIKKEEKRDINQSDIIKLSDMNKFLFIFSVISSMIFGLYVNVYNIYASAILTALCIIICLTPFALYIFYPNYVSLKDNSRYDDRVQHGRLNIVQHVMLFPLCFGLLSIIEQNLFVKYSWNKLLIYSVVLFAIVVAVLLSCNKEYKKEKSVLFVIIFASLFLCPSIIHKIDMNYDFYPPEQIYCEITDTPIWTNNDGEITYYLTFNYEGEDIKTEVSQEFYESHFLGDELLLIKLHGALGIEKLILVEN